MLPILTQEITDQTYLSRMLCTLKNEDMVRLVSAMRFDKLLRFAVTEPKTCDIASFICHSQNKNFHKIRVGIFEVLYFSD